MKPASIRMSSKIKETNFRPPKYEIVTNVNAKGENDVNNIKRLLIEQIYSTVKWRKFKLYVR